MPDPGIDALQAIADWYGFEIPASEADTYVQLVGGALTSMDRLQELDAQRRESVAARSNRDAGSRPAVDENPLNAWYWRCSIAEADQGRLAGLRVGIKDNVAVAGVPMMAGTALLEGFVPETDATVVTRVLAAGGQILGKAVCEPLCTSDGSHSADTGPVRNPHDRSRSAGGSSSGSAALVASGEIDVAIGTDSAGSIRMPAALCGIFGLKPSFGLVPCQGMVAGERTLDHIGPMGARVSDLAALLEAIAGPERDQSTDSVADKPLDLSSELEAGVRGLRIGVLEEGFGRPNSQSEVDAVVREAAARLGGLGAQVESVSIPWHLDGEHVWNAIALEGLLDLLIRGNGSVTNGFDVADPALVEALFRGRSERGSLLPLPVKLIALTGEHLRRKHGGAIYIRARRLLNDLRAAYDSALSRFDALVLPTTPTVAPPLPDKGASTSELFAASFTLHGNTCPINATGHPAMSVPCGWVDGLPVGLMAVAATGEDALLLRLARACEAEGISEVLIPAGT